MIRMIRMIRRHYSYFFNIWPWMGLGARFGLTHIEFIALIVFLVQIMLSRLWLRYFRFGPLEWLWRICTYGKYYPIKA